MLYRLISKFSRKCDYEILSTMKKNLTYEELFEANVRLQEENNVLKDEIKHLKMQLHIDDKPQKSIAVTRLSLEKRSHCLESCSMVGKIFLQEDGIARIVENLVTNLYV